MKLSILVRVFLLTLVLTASGYAQSATSGNSRGKSPWMLAWSDEFNGPDGSPPDARKWSLETGGNGWGNQELEYYTERPKNVHLEHGRLVITARREDYTGRDGISRHFTSARIKTQGKFAQAYGRFEARIRLPTGQGLWPAFWMLGDNIEQTGWPACGEIDIMENIGNELSTVHGTIHGPGYSGDNGIGAPFSLPSARFAHNYHIFAVEWEPNVIRFYVDKHLYETRTPADLTAGTSWVYNHPFFLILNVAVGGSWPGNPDSTTTFPQAMLVDYVRVYRRSAHDFAQLLVNRLHADVNCAKQSRHLRPVHLAVFGRGWSTSPATRGQALLLEGCVTCPRLRPRAPAGGVRALMAANARMRPHFAIRAGRVFCNRRVYVHAEPA